jgi:hypothetical protein
LTSSTSSTLIIGDLAGLENPEELAQGYISVHSLPPSELATWTTPSYAVNPETVRDKLTAQLAKEPESKTKEFYIKEFGYNPTQTKFPTPTKFQHEKPPAPPLLDDLKIVANSAYFHEQILEGVAIMEFNKQFRFYLKQMQTGDQRSVQNYVYAQDGRLGKKPHNLSTIPTYPLADSPVHLVQPSSGFYLISSQNTGFFDVDSKGQLQDGTLTVNSIGFLAYLRHILPMTTSNYHISLLAVVNTGQDIPTKTTSTEPEFNLKVKAHLGSVRTLEFAQSLLFAEPILKTAVPKCKDSSRSSSRSELREEEKEPEIATNLARMWTDSIYFSLAAKLTPRKKKEKEKKT